MSGEPGNTPNIAQVIDNAEIQRRLAALEGTTTKLQEALVDRRLGDLEEAHKQLQITQTDRNLRTLSIIFASMTLFLIVITLMAKWDTKEAALKVDQAITNMNSRFELLAGESLKKPLLQIFWKQSPLDGQTIDIPVLPNTVPVEIPLTALFLTNSSTKRTEPLSIAISVNGQLVEWGQRTDWDMVASADTNYSVTFSSKQSSDTVAARQMWNVHPLTFMIQSFAFGPTNFPCKMLVYYGGDKEAEAHFRVRITQRPF